MDIISGNPYRLLGVYSNSPIKDRIANANKMKAYLKVGKSVSFPLDLLNLIPVPVRIVENMEHANGSINLPQDQLKYALFWFIKVTSIDEIAMGYLQKGKTEKAKELFGKKETFSSLINLGVLSLIQNDLVTAVQTITKVIHNDDYRVAFGEAVCGSTYQLSEDDLARLFMDQLLMEIPAQNLMQLFSKYGISIEDNTYLKNKVVGDPIAIINVEIEKSKTLKNDDSDVQYRAGVTLMNSTKESLGIIRSVLSENDIQYQMVVDNLAKQILQCGINYYNNSKELDSAIKAMPIQKYALHIAVGALTKDRCKENVDILQKIIDELPPLDVLQEADQIRRALERFTQNKKISVLKSALFSEPRLIEPTENDLEFVHTLLHDTKIELDKIKISYDYYWKMTDLIVNCALSEVIEYVNAITSRSQPYLSFEREQTLRNLRVAMNNAIRIMHILDKFDMTSDFKTKRYAPNKNALMDLKRQLNVSNQNSNSGCMIWIIIFIVGLVAVSCI